MNIKSLSLLFALISLLVFISSSIVFADAFQDGLAPYNRGDFNEAVKEYRLHEQLAEIAPSQALMVMCFQ